MSKATKKTVPFLNSQVLLGLFQRENYVEAVLFFFRVDFVKYPGLIDVEYYNVTMQAGDCLYIPHRW